MTSSRVGLLAVGETMAMVAPVLPEGIGHLRVDDIPLLGGRLSVAVAGGEVTVEGVPPGIEVVTAPRRAVGGPESG